MIHNKKTYKEKTKKTEKGVVSTNTSRM